MKTNLIFTIFFLLFSEGLLAVNTGKYFSISADTLVLEPGEELDSNALSARLKKKVITDYLEKRLGHPTYEKYESLITEDFIETYVIDFQLIRQPGQKNKVLEGHFDTAGLDSWIRSNETKSSGANVLKPILFFSSNIPGSSFHNLRINHRNTERF
jgi:hypothetical protein